MLEEEIRIGEQEREGLRIEAQRLREELSDLKIEAEITQEKLRKLGSRKPHMIDTNITAPNSPLVGGSPDSAASSPMITTPPDTKSVSTTDTISETPTPPSPPMSEASATAMATGPLKTPHNPPRTKLRLPSGEFNGTPKPAYYSSTMRRPSVAGKPPRPPPSINRQAAGKAPPSRGIPNSTSLTHIRSLTAQMQRLEQRVHSARSKLPGPVNTPPRASPRNGSAHGHHVPSSVTIRNRKRTSGSIASGISAGSSIHDDPGAQTPASTTKQVNRLSTSGISRLSFGPVNSRESRDEGSRPTSRSSTASFARPERPVSRSEIGRPASRNEIQRTEIVRPGSRASLSGSRTPLGHYSQSSIAESRRPRSSIGGNYAASHGHGHSQSVSHIDFDETKELNFETPSRRGTLSRGDEPPSGLPRRQSGGAPTTSTLKRTSSGLGFRESDGAMKPPGRPRKLSGVGETY